MGSSWSIQPGDGAPGIEGARFMPHLPGVADGARQHPGPALQQGFGRLWRGQQKEGEHVDLRVPEIVALIALSGQALGG